MKIGLQILALALTYAAAGATALSPAFTQAHLTGIWPSAGIAVAALLVGGLRLWPGVFIGAALVHYWNVGNLPSSLGVAAGNSAEALITAYLMNRFARGRNVFGSPWTIAKGVFFVLIGAAVSATVGISVWTKNGLSPNTVFTSHWVSWLMANIGGILLLTPLLVLWTAQSQRRWDRRKAIEAGALILSLGLSGWLIFGSELSAKIAPYPLEPFCVPALLWAAFRFGQREAATAAILLWAMAVWGTLEGFGPFAHIPAHDRMAVIEVYIGMLSMINLAVAAIVAERTRINDHLEVQIRKRTDYLRNSLNHLDQQTEERERAEGALRLSEARFNRLIKSNMLGIIAVDGSGRIWEGNDAFQELIGCTRDDLRNGTLNAFEITPPEYRSQESWAWEQLRTKGNSPPLEKEFVRRDGRRIPVLVGGVLLDRSPERSVFFVIDVTQRRLAMEALRKAYDDIELRVEKRTSELLEANQELGREVARRQKAESNLRDLSLKDPLTGLYNRRGFLALAEQQWLQAIRDRRSFLVFFADVDQLKPINDIQGHLKGDQALVEAANALSTTFRKSDIIARIGGDEFAVVAAQAPLEHADIYLKRLQDHLDEINASNRLSFKLSLSIGAAVLDVKMSTSIQDLLRQADDNLYAQKRKRKSLQIQPPL